MTSSQIVENYLSNPSNLMELLAYIRESQPQVDNVCLFTGNTHKMTAKDRALNANLPSE
jgi:hypothetical protein